MNFYFINEYDSDEAYIPSQSEIDEKSDKEEGKNIK